MLATLTLATDNTRCQLPYIQYTWAINSSSFTNLLLLISEISVTETITEKGNNWLDDINGNYGDFQNGNNIKMEILQNV